MTTRREGFVRGALIVGLSGLTVLSGVALWLVTGPNAAQLGPSVEPDAVAIVTEDSNSPPVVLGSVPETSPQTSAEASTTAEPTAQAQIRTEFSTTPLQPPTATDALLSPVTDMSIFFGHQSVGGNLLRGLEDVYADSSRSVTIVETERPDGSPGVLAHAFIGENREPLEKIQHFADIIRGGAGDVVDVAFMKLCYADVTEDTDILAVFDTYQRTMSDLERTYDDVRFLHVTVPLTCAEPHPEDNVAREAFNTLIRDEYGDTGRVYDLAAIEATAPDGAIVQGEVEGSRYAALFEGYTHDCGHLNEQGRVIAALGLLDTLAQP
jgi:hypothetical protein